MSLFYYLVLFLVTKDPSHPLQQFRELQPWMGILIVGFGIQVGIYFLLRNGFRLDLKRDKEAKMTTGMGGAMSGASMIACCVHHVADVTPIMGVTGASVFLTDYQKEFLYLGILTNLLGIMYMTWVILGRRSAKELLNYRSGGREGVR